MEAAAYRRWERTQKKSSVQADAMAIEDGLEQIHQPIRSRDAVWPYGRY